MGTPFGDLDRYVVALDRRRLIEEGKVRFVAIQPRPTLTGDLSKETEILEARDETVGSRKCDLESIGYVTDVDDWSLKKCREQLEPVWPDALFDHGAAVEFTQLEDTLGCPSGFVGRRGDATEKKPKPSFPVAVATDGHQTVVVLGAVQLEEVAQVQQRPTQRVAMNQQESD
jgi:hypothetical protein